MADLSKYLGDWLAESAASPPPEPAPGPAPVAAPPADPLQSYLTDWLKPDEGPFAARMKENTANLVTGVGELGKVAGELAGVATSPSPARAAELMTGTGRELASGIGKAAGDAKTRVLEASSKSVLGGTREIGATALDVLALPDLAETVRTGDFGKLWENRGRATADILFSVPQAVSGIAGGVAAAASKARAAGLVPGPIARAADKIGTAVIPKYNWTEGFHVAEAQRQGGLLGKTILETGRGLDESRMIAKLDPKAMEFLSPELTTTTGNLNKFHKWYDQNYPQGQLGPFMPGTFRKGGRNPLHLGVDDQGNISYGKASDFQNLAPEVQRRISDVRTMIDNNSAEIWRRGIISDKEYFPHYYDYMRRMYHIHYDPREWLQNFGYSKWSGSPTGAPSATGQQLMNDARTWLTGKVADPDATISWILEQGNRVAFDPYAAQVQGAMGSAVQSLLKRRDVPEAIHNLMGPLSPENNPIRVGTTLDFQNKVLTADDMMVKLAGGSAGTAFDGRPFVFKDPKLATRHADYQQLPDHPVFGRWKGALVHPDIHDSLVTLASPTFSGTFDKYMKMWKAGHVTFNPATHMSNFMGDAVFSTLVGNSVVNPANWGHYKQAGADLAHFWANPQEAMANRPGLYRSITNGATVPGFANAEVADIMAQVAAHGASNPMEAFMDIMMRHPGATKTMQAYDLMDQWFRHAAYLKGEAKNGTSVPAVNRTVYEINNAFPNYEKSSPFGNWMRGSSYLGGISGHIAAGALGAPFASFPLEAMRIYQTAAREHPYRLIAATMIPYSTTTLALGMEGKTIKDYAEERKGWPDYAKGRMMVPIPGAEGMVDISRIMPLGDVFEAPQLVEDLTGWKIPFNPAKQFVGQGLLLRPGLETINNRNMETGQPITNFEQGAGTGDFLYNLLKRLAPLPGAVWTGAERIAQTRRDVPVDRYEEEPPTTKRSLADTLTPFRFIGNDELAARGKAESRGEFARERSYLRGRHPELTDEQRDERRERIIERREQRRERRD